MVDDVNFSVYTLPTPLAIPTADLHGVWCSPSLAIAVGASGGHAPVPVLSLLQIAAGDGPFTCGIRTSNRSLVCWGYDPSGVILPVPSGAFDELVAGGYHACARRANGSVVCWGLNNSNQLNVPPGTYVRLGLGGEASCALRDDGTPVCWGDPTDQATVPIVRPLATVDGSGISYTGDMMCSVARPGALACW